MRGYTANGKSWIDWEGRDKEDYQENYFMYHLRKQLAHQFAGENGVCNVKNVTPALEEKKHPGAAAPLGAQKKYRLNYNTKLGKWKEKL